MVQPARSSLRQAPTSDGRKNHRLHGAIKSPPRASPRLVCSMNSVGVSSHARVSRVVPASASARAPAALGVLLASSPAAAVDARSMACMVMSHCTWPLFTFECPEVHELQPGHDCSSEFTQIKAAVLTVDMSP